MIFLFIELKVVIDSKSCLSFIMIVIYLFWTLLETFDM